MPKIANKEFSGRPLDSPENGKPENLKTQTFLVTLSPKDDVTPDTVAEFVKYVQKKTLYAFVCLEYGANGKKHLHAVCAWQIPVERRNIHDYWSRRMVQEYPGSIGRYACVVTVQYNHKWYDEYLRKGGEVVFDNYDRDKVSELFPTLEQQAQLCEIKNSTEVRVHVADMLLAEWVEKSPDTSYESAIRFMKYRMYVENKTPYYIDDCKMHQMCWFLYEKRNQICEVNVADRNYVNMKSGNASSI